MSRPAVVSATYRTYAAPLKRKRTSTASFSDRHTTEHDRPLLQRPSKKSRYAPGQYNPNVSFVSYNPRSKTNTQFYFMAEMCFSAHVSRQRDAGMPMYTEDTAHDIRQDLLEMFKSAKSKGTFRHDAAARHTIPRLARDRPRTNNEKKQLIEDFIQHHRGVYGDLEVIAELMGRGFQIDDDFITTIRETLVGLHKACADGGMWRNIMPYTPLPLDSLRTVRHHINWSRQSRNLNDLIDSIDDINVWLSLPLPSLEFTPDLIESARDAMKARTEEKIAKANMGLPVERHPDVGDRARVEEQDAQRQRVQKEQSRQRDESRIEAEQHAAEREQAR
ncbi:hypothetical protein BDW02DRAFT_603468 [Decorospora gaudefroyi]|uniref:Uncharacterized protein n=1 Tax=Decorospora gaudefroyi TaxID=184978 RepID=A0A6A5K1J2_9PLEO|nr:hypothetical protein BDW02DRAFT_603468 [Decorospora gaudefroyi]